MAALPVLIGSLVKVARWPVPGARRRRYQVRGGVEGYRVADETAAVVERNLDATDIGLAISLGVVATVIAGLYPTWRAVQVQPAWQLKAL